MGLNERGVKLKKKKLKYTRKREGREESEIHG